MRDNHGLRPHCFLEIRFSDADDIWLSPSYNQRSCWIGIIQWKCVRPVFFFWREAYSTCCFLSNRPYGFPVPYRLLFERFERIVTYHGGRPHWAKTHSLRPDALSALYPRFEAFREVLKAIDPEGVFRNEYISRHIIGETAPRFGERVFKSRQI